VPPGSIQAIAIPTGPADDTALCTLMFLAAICAAEKRLWITSPYFVPDETVYDALQLAALRGVDVRIILPDKPDHLLVYLSSFSYLESAERVGVKFYRYRAGFLHQKVMLIDDDLAAVGTANLDNRSMRLNFELTLLFVDPTFARQTAEMLEKDFAQCERATPGDLGRRALPFRVAVRIARLLSPVQ
jgi:cardiolipin synthase